MLFRPFKEWRILRVRVPFTPGIIPRQRYKLAENIGQMVSDELLTTDTFVKQVRSASFRAGLDGAVSRVTEKLLNTPVGELKLRRSDTDSIELLSLAEEIIRAFLRSKGIKRIIDLVIHTGLRALTNRKIGELFGDERQKERFIAWIVTLLRAPDTGKSIVEKTRDWFGDENTRKLQVGEYLPPETTDWVAGFADVLYDPVFGFLLDWLGSPSMRRQLEKKARELLKQILDKLSVFQRFLVAATQYDRTLDEKMPDIVHDVLSSMKETVENESTRAKMLDTIREKIDRLRERPLGEVDASMNITSRLETALDSIQNTILERALTVDDAADYLSNLVVRNVQESADRISKVAIDHLSKIVDASGNSRIGELVGITSEVKGKIDIGLSDMAESALVGRIPDILDSLDLNGVVVSKINSFSVEDVEGLLMRVIHRHLKWINVFGAILGFLIGAIQILTRLL
jgi:uncharacterized membrane protein YheB (UPF0754 family)